MNCRHCGEKTTANGYCSVECHRLAFGLCPSKECWKDRHNTNWENDFADSARGKVCMSCNTAIPLERFVSVEESYYQQRQKQKERFKNEYKLCLDNSDYVDSVIAADLLGQRGQRG